MIDPALTLALTLVIPGTLLVAAVADSLVMLALLQRLFISLNDWS
jgi:hypothetical protein